MACAYCYRALLNTFEHILSQLMCFKMNWHISYLPVFLVCILASQTIAWDENSFSRLVITRNHRRLKGFTFNTFHSASLVSCGLKCQRNPRCFSTNFRKISKLNECKGVCELNDRGVVLPIEGTELEYEEESLYTQYYDMKVREILFNR